MKRLKSLSVDRISILTTDHEPAVPKAGLGFSILKFFRRDKPDTSRLESIVRKLAGTPEKSGTSEDSGRLDAILEKLSASVNGSESTSEAEKPE